MVLCADYFVFGAAHNKRLASVGGSADIQQSVPNFYAGLCSVSTRLFAGARERRGTSGSAAAPLCRPEPRAVVVWKAAGRFKKFEG